MDDLIRRSDAIKAIMNKPAWHGSEGSWFHSDDIKDAIESIPAVESNLILPERVERDEVYDVGETITVMNHEDYMDMMCKAMMWDEYGKEPKRGEWVKEIDTMSGSKDYAPINYYCSECGEFSPTVLNFCSNCGAKMKGADDEVL